MPRVKPKVISATTSDVAPVFNPERGTVTATTSKRGSVPQVTAGDEELLRLARQRFNTSASADAKLRDHQRQDLLFRASEQWPANIKAERDQDQRPCLTINRLPVFIRQVTNQQRQSKPSIQINPVDSGSDPDTAEVLQGIIRHIELNSQADVAYDTACDSQVTIGRGYVRILVDWSEDNPWEQEIKIKRVRNPFLVYFDPACQEIDYRDGRFAFVIEDVPKDEFKAQYGAEAASATTLFASLGDTMQDWMPEGKVRVAEYFWVETTTENISLLSNGTEMPTVATKTPEMQMLFSNEGITVLRSRDIQTRQVKWAKITGNAVLERRDWPGKWIPIVPVLGDEIDINGMVDLRGMVRDAKDPQRMYNYWVSAETEAIALAPRTPFVGAEGQFEGHEVKWKNANRRNYPYLEYKIKSLGGQLAPPPQRNAIEPPIMAIVAATKQSDNDLKAVTGLYDASLGSPGPEQSGKAILARQRQGDVANVNWIDNLGRAIKAVGRILLDLIPQIYDAPRVLRIMGKDDQPQMVMVHAGNPPTSDPTTDETLKGLKGVYDLSVGRYDVTVSVGPSYQSRRQEAVEAMMSFVQAFPPAAPAIGDVLAENMDWPGAQVIAKRLKKMLPPMLQDKPPGEPDIPPQVQQKLAQLEQMMQMMQEQLKQAGRIIETEQVKQQAQVKAKELETGSRERIAAAQFETQITVAEIGAQKALAQTLADTQRAHTEQLLGIEADRGLRVLDQRHERAQGQADRYHAAREGAIDRQHEMLTGAVDRTHERRQAEDDRTHAAEQAEADRVAAAEQAEVPPTGGEEG